MNKTLPTQTTPHPNHEAMQVAASIIRAVQELAQTLSVDTVLDRCQREYPGVPLAIACKLALQKVTDVHRAALQFDREQKLAREAARIKNAPTVSSATRYLLTLKKGAAHG